MSFCYLIQTAFFVFLITSLCFLGKFCCVSRETSIFLENCSVFSYSASLCLFIMYCDRSSLTGFVVHVDVFVCICANCALRVFAVHCCCSVFLLPVEFLWRYASYYCVFYRYSAGFVIFDRLFVFFLEGVWNFCFLVFKRSVVCWCVFSAVVFLSRWALRLCFLCVMFTSVAFFCAYALKIKWGSGAIWSTRISRFGSDCCVLMECVALEYVRLRYFLRCRNAVPVF